MGKGVKRTISIILTACILCAVVCTQVGAMCQVDHVDHAFDETYTVGDFEMFSYYKDNSERYYVAGLSEQGKSKKELVISYEYNGKKLWVGRIKRNLFYNEIHPKIITEDSITEKIFLKKDFETYGEADDKSVFYKPGSDFSDGWFDFNNNLPDTFTHTANFKKIIYNSFYDHPINEFYTYICPYIIDNGSTNTIINMDTGIRIYINWSLFDFCFKNYIANGDIWIRYIVPEEGLKFWSSVRFLLRFEECFINTCVLANVDYMYNFDGALNRGHYWLDDVENGKTIITIPEAPTREGYAFGGWYTEPECINEFDFNTPITKQEVDWEKIYGLEETLPENYVTFLYAKWIENN